MPRIWMWTKTDYNVSFFIFSSAIIVISIYITKKNWNKILLSCLSDFHQVFLDADWELQEFNFYNKNAINALNENKNYLAFMSGWPWVGQPECFIFQYL